MIKINRTTRNLFDVGSAAFLCLARDAGLDPFDELVLGDGHTLADFQRREAFAVHQFISVGAGDAFCAGCLYGIYNNYTDIQTLEFASAAAACNLLEANAIDGMKPRNEILKLAEKYGCDSIDVSRDLAERKLHLEFSDSEFAKAAHKVANENAAAMLAK